MDNSAKYISQEQQEEFERFLLNQMEFNEESSFNEKLERDPSLKKQFEEFKALFFTVEEAGLRQVLNNFHDNLPTPKEGRKRNFSLYRIAAGVAVLVALGLWFFNRPGPNDRLYETYFVADPGLPTVMGNSNNYEFYEAMVEYKQGNYVVAIQKWERLYEEKSENDTLNYFLGAALLAKNLPKQAMPYFEKVLNNQDSFFLDDAHFYLALAHIKEGQTTEAIKNLEASKNPKGKQLLTRLQNAIP